MSSAACQSPLPSISFFLSFSALRSSAGILPEHRALNLAPFQRLVSSKNCPTARPPSHGGPAKMMSPSNDFLSQLRSNFDLVCAVAGLPKPYQCVQPCGRLECVHLLHTVNSPCSCILHMRLRMTLYPVVYFADSPAACL